MKTSTYRLELIAACAALALSACANRPTGAQIAPTAAPSPTPQPAVAAATVPAPTPSPIPPTRAPLPTAVPTLAPTPAPTATPKPATRFAQLTQGGCCVQPFFHPDGQRVLFLDKPGAQAPLGFYGVSATGPMAEPALFTARLGPFSGDLRYAQSLERGQTVIERLSDGVKWTIQNGGRRVTFSPDGARIAWSVGEEVGTFDVRRQDIWVADVDGRNAKRVTTRYGGGMQAWFRDGKRILVTGKAQRGDALAGIAVVSIEDGATRELADVERLRNAVLSPEGRFLVYYMAGARDPELNGTWLLDVEAVGKEPVKLDIFGAFRWRDEGRLFYIPLQQGAPSTELVQLDVRTGQRSTLIRAAADSPFRIANGDWDVSADGKRIVFLSARDRNVWVAELAE